ncbi:zinc finger, CCHC-type containing protein [Tanacetum coccineum]
MAKTMTGLLLGRVHFKRMQDMSKDELILTFDMDTGNHLCDLYAIPLLENWKYFVTFIDDASRFCYVYLLHTKDEAKDSGVIGEHYKDFSFYAIKPNELVSIYSIIESSNAIFDENRFSLVPRPSLRIPNGTEDTGALVVDMTKEFLSLMFSMKNMGDADVILVSTLMDTSEKLMPNNGQAVSQLEYSWVIACLMYEITCTRPNITFVVGKLSRYTSNPSAHHWQAIQGALKYLKKTMDYSLTYIGYP